MLRGNPIVPAILVALAGILLAPLASAQQATGWEPDPARLGQLGDPIDAGSVKFRLPKNFQETAPPPGAVLPDNLPPNIRFERQFWTPGGKAVDDPSNQQFFAYVEVSGPQDDSPPPPLPELTKNILAGQSMALQKQIPGVQILQGEPEVGSVSGVPFCRIRCTLNHPNAGNIGYQFIMVAARQSQPQLIILVGQGTNGDQVQTLETAALTTEVVPKVPGR